nr:disease resistance protein RPP13-like isoform X6 [Ipomoea batatas]
MADIEVYVNHKIVDLVHLRYLSNSIIVDGISKLKRFRSWNLQTLSIKSKFDHGDDEMPYYIWELPQLRYLDSYSICRHPPKFVCPNLQSISELKDLHCKNIDFFATISCLKNLCVYWFHMDMDNINNLACLHHLERLKIICGHGLTNAVWNQIALLKSIKKLSLSFSGIQWKEVTVLSKLPRLEVLKSKEQWKASEEHFPKLEHLLIRHCIPLKEIPSDFAEISTLKSIELAYCLPFLVDSAKQIQKEQDEYGNSNMVRERYNGMCGETDFDLLLYGLDELEIDEVKHPLRFPQPPPPPAAPPPLLAFSSPNHLLQTYNPASLLGHSDHMSNNTPTSSLVLQPGITDDLDWRSSPASISTTKPSPLPPSPGLESTHVYNRPTM